MIHISVVIPVFNAEKHLSGCIESLLEQTLASSEFIFINDGSTDESQKIIEGFQQKDNRIILFNQENAGVSAARNKGIELAKGDYIGFVDADDAVANDMYATLFALAEAHKTDIVVSNFIAEQDGVVVHSKSFFETNKVFAQIEIQQQILPFFISADGLNSCCTKIYKRDLLQKNQIIFPQGLALGEDALFNMQAFAKASNVIFADYNGYFYKEVAGSATRDILKRDYFGSTLSAYHMDYTQFLSLDIGPEKMAELKAIRLMESVVSLIHIYLKPNKTIPFSTRYGYVKKMLANAIVNQNIHKYWQILTRSTSRYQLFILNCIKSKSALSLLPAVFYSNLRNKK
ncbi:MAG TPA: glycosyltransferase [Flavobacterium sp.]|nr:glycosyltransferase [Flavobacterium sp.]